MNMILIPRNSADSNGESLLRFALTNEPVAGVVLDGLRRLGDLGCDSIVRLADKKSLGKTFYAIPEEWDIEHFGSQYEKQLPRKSLYDVKPNIIRYKDNIPVPMERVYRIERDRNSNSWFVVSNGRFATHINVDFLEKVFTSVRADVVAVNAEPELLGQREKVRLTTEGKLAGFCRAYSDSAEFTFISPKWPHHLFVKTDALDRVLDGGDLPHSFSALFEKCNSNALKILAINVGGIVQDLEDEDGFLTFCKTRLSKIQNSKLELRDSSIIDKRSRFRIALSKGHNSIGQNRLDIKAKGPCYRILAGRFVPGHEFLMLDA